MKFPKQVFVKVVTPNNGAPYLDCNADLAALTEDERTGDKVKVGVFQLVELQTYQKRIVKLAQVVTSRYAVRKAKS